MCLKHVFMHGNRTAFGHITLIIPDEGIKVDTTCAGCCTGWVWCGGYMGDADAERSIVLCEYAWFGLISVVKASGMRVMLFVYSRGILTPGYIRVTNAWFFLHMARFYTPSGKCLCTQLAYIK